jgi:Ca-activated chloride channel family protein
MPFRKAQTNTSSRLLRAQTFIALLMSMALLVGCGTPDRDSSGEEVEKETPVQSTEKEDRDAGTTGTSEAEVTGVAGEDPAEQAHRDLLAKYDAGEITAPTPPRKSYEQRLAKFGEDYAECGAKVTTSGQKCEKPASLGDRELKENINVQLILDSSGSMQGEVSGERKIDVAKRVLTDFVGTLPETANVSLRVYGHVGSNSQADRAESCAASELVLPFQKLDRAGFTKAIDSRTYARTI